MLLRQSRSLFWLSICLHPSHPFPKLSLMLISPTFALIQMMGEGTKLVSSPILHMLRGPPALLGWTVKLGDKIKEKPERRREAEEDQGQKRACLLLTHLYKELEQEEAMLSAAPRICLLLQQYLGRTYPPSSLWPPSNLFSSHQLWNDLSHP